MVVMAQKGVNLGGWLVLEKWITPSLFTGTDAKDEYSLVSAGDAYQTRVQKHYRTFITESDITWLKDRGVSHIRVPVGYWLFGEQAPFLPCLAHLDNLFDWADTHNMKILLNIHGAPGSQNGKFHSGRLGAINWYKHRQQLADFTEQVVNRYGDRTSFDGLGLLNEPSPQPGNILKLIRYYRMITRRLRRKVPGVQLYIDGTYLPLLWVWVAWILGVGIDKHVYPGFGNTTIKTARRKLSISHMVIRIINSIVPLIIGEWSGVIDHQPGTQSTKRYIQDQATIYSRTHAEYYWTYRTESNDIWSFRALNK